jgi:integrin beta 3
MSAAQTEEIADIIVAAVRAATAPVLLRCESLEAQVKALESRAPVPGPAGEKGERGEAGPKGHDGIGATGPAGRDGIDGKDASVDVEEIARRAAALVPRAKDGADGKDGANGVGVAGAVIDKDGSLVLTLSDGSLHTLGMVVGRPGDRGEKGNDGANGRDGTLEGVEFKQFSERQGAFVRADGSQVGIVKLAGFVDKGVYRETQTYERGDLVSFGHIYIAQRDVSEGEKPIDGNPHEGQAWRLAVKRGRDGKVGPPGERGPKGERGDRGDPGRNFS